MSSQPGDSCCGELNNNTTQRNVENNIKERMNSLVLWEDAHNLFDESEKPIYRVIGLIFATFVASLYYVSVGFIFMVIVLFYLFGVKSWITYTYAGVLLLIQTMPANFFNLSYKSKIYKSIPLYFDAKVYGETEATKFVQHKKPILYLYFPHGIVTFGGWTTCMKMPRDVNSAVSEILLKLPFIRNVFSPFNLIPPSRKALLQSLNVDRTDCILYPGGLAELFLSNPAKEYCYFKHRQGCIKIAMQGGADICIVYLYGNTQLYKLVRGSLPMISRALRISIALFKGRFNTTIPYYTPLISVFSDIIEMPDYSAAEKINNISKDVIEQQHEKVYNRLRQHYDKYKILHQAYINKNLTFV